MSRFKQPTRVLAYIKKTLESEDPLPIEFGTCLIDSLPHNGKKVSCELQDNMLILSGEDEGGGLPIQHSSNCPMREITETQRKGFPKDITIKGVGAAVCVLVQSLDDELLLTRRSKHMRTFPNVWVPPGGGIELDETLEAAGLRELQEETGLSFTSSEMIDFRPLCVWESVYPPLISRGLPKRQHLVVYCLTKINQISKNLDSKISLSPEETDAFMWLSKVDAIRMCFSKEAGSPLTVFEIPEGYVQKPYSLLLDDAPTQGDDIERISTGTRFAVEQWIMLDNLSH